MVKVPYFDDIEVELADDVDPSESGAQATLAAFLALTPQNRIADSRHVFAYYQDVRDVIGGEDWLDEEMGVPETPAEIWRYVVPRSIALEQDPYGDDGGWYVAVEADCGWEEEHGLMLVWRGGTTLTKVGEYDGHLTNANAYDDDRLHDVVYQSSSPEYVTRLDGGA